jgi:hypothetical protein
MAKPLKSVLLTSLVAAACWTVLPASTALMSVDDVRPGMEGIGRTVFDGTEPEEFKVHVLGVLRNMTGPQRNLILARLEGGPLANTGVMQGMSGSPVYVNGKLLGAVSYSIGAFSKEPIAGITPIAEMTETAALAPRRPSIQKAALSWPLTRENVAAALRAAYDRVRPFADHAGDVQAFGLPTAEADRMSMLLRPIATPMVMAGFAPQTASLLSGPFQDAGFSPVLGSAGSGGADDAAGASGRSLQAGDAIGVALMGGDLELGATGTVSYVDGQHVYAFGHPFLGLGPTAFPMTRARVYSLLPSLMTSFKISTMGDVIGTFQQDRATGIAGTLGKGPEMVPVRITLQSERGLTRTFTFQVVNDQLFTPLLTYVSVFNTIGSYERQMGSATYAIKGVARVKGQQDIAIEDVFAGDNAVAGAAAAVAGPVTYLMTNDLEKVDVRDIDITLTSYEEPRIATIERVWLDEVRPRAGRTVPLKVLLRSYRGDEEIRTVPIEIPVNAPSTVSLLVSDGATLSRWEQRELKRPGQPETVPQMIRSLNTTRRNNRLYVRLVADEPGAVVQGETLPSLPPSVLAVLEADRNGGSFVPLRNAVLGAWELSSDKAIAGSRILTVQLEPPSGAQ